MDNKTKCKHERSPAEHRHLKSFAAFVHRWIRLICVFLHREAEDDVVYEGNQRWEGYSMDLIDAISKILHFQYTFELVPDGEKTVSSTFLT